MTRFGLIAIFALLHAGTAGAQGQVFEPTVPGAQQQRVEPLQPDEVPPQPALNVRRHEMDADARHCLQQSSNMDVHRCAEKYRGRALRTAAAKPARSGGTLK